MNTTQPITGQLVADDQRLNITADLFGIKFPLCLEPCIFSMAEILSSEYNGGYWHFYTLSNGGFYMAPNSEANFHVACENGFEGNISADALGIAACLYAYSHLSFGEGEGEREFAEVCVEHYHWLREFLLEHAEAACILGAID